MAQIRSQFYRGPNINKNSRVADVRDFFKVFGDLRDVYLPKDYYTKESKGVAYVE